MVQYLALGSSHGHACTCCTCRATWLPLPLPRRPHFGEVHANLRLSVARAHQAVMQQREAAAASLAASLTATVPLQHALAPGALIGAAPIAAMPGAAGVSAGSAARPPVPLSMPVAALLRAPSSSNLVSGGVAPVPGVPRVPMHHLQLPGDVVGPAAAAAAGPGAAPPAPSPRSSAAGVPAAVAGLPAGALLGPAVGLAGRPVVPSGPTGGTAAAGLGVGGVGSGNGVACRPSFTPSFPALPQQATGTQTPADMLRAIFNGQPPAVAAAAAAAAASSANKPATAGLRQGSSRVHSQVQGSVPRIGSSPAIVPQAGQQPRAPPRAP